MRGDVFADVEVEGDEHVHGDCDGGNVEKHHPEMREGWVERIFAVVAGDLGYGCDYGGGYTDEAVLEDGEPDYLDAN